VRAAEAGEGRRVVASSRIGVCGQSLPPGHSGGEAETQCCKPGAIEEVPAGDVATHAQLAIGLAHGLESEYSSARVVATDGRNLMIWDRLLLEAASRAWVTNPLQGP
jgi:hypothetical protein